MSECGENETGSRIELGSGEIGVLRIIDAEANRAAEGLRVVEDYVRFVLSDEHLTRLAKELRHELAAALREIATARATRCPAIGRRRWRGASSRGGAAAEAASRRGHGQHEAGPAGATRIGRVRQIGACVGGGPPTRLAVSRLYARARHWDHGHSIDRLADARLYVLLDGRGGEEEFTALAESLVEARVDILQLRDKALDDRRLLSRARRLREITHGSKTLFIMNDRADLAALSQADGVHVGQDELTVHDARRIVGPKALVGVSTHSIEQARQAVIDGANYIGVGPTFPSGTKSFASFTGLELLRAVASEISLPTFAIGGITAENLPSVLASGIRRVAVTGAVVNAAEPKKAAGELLKTLG